jgi:hypothetical protein
MVDYIPLSRRRRNAALLALATLLAGVVLGMVVGRSTAITASEAARDVRSQGDTLGTRIEALTIEYDQAVSGGGDTIQGGVLDALDLIDTDIDGLIDEAPWLGPTQVQQLHDATAAVRAAGENAVDPDQFSTIASSTATLIRDTFGVSD